MGSAELIEAMIVFRVLTGIECCHNLCGEVRERPLLEGLFYLLNGKSRIILLYCKRELVRIG